MAKIARKYLKVFGASGPTNDFAVFGSQEAADPVKSKDIEAIQALAAWDDGLADAIVDANKAPYMEDINAVLYVFGYQMGYILQEGIPEWDDGTTYYTNSIIKKTGTLELYSSKTDDNLANALPSKVDNTNWKYIVDLADIVPNLSITTAKINDLAVTTGKLDNLSVTAAKLAADAVETAKIKDLNVTAAKLVANINLVGYIKRTTTALTKVYMYSDQVMSSSPAKLNLTVSWDLSSNWDVANKRFICPVAGYYRVTAMLAVDASVSSALYMYVNGAAGIRVYVIHDSYSTVMFLHDIYKCTTPGDYLEIWMQYGTVKGNIYGLDSSVTFELIA